MGNLIHGEQLGYMLDEIKDVSGYLWQSGCTPASGGNLSVDVTEAIDADGSDFEPGRQDVLPVRVSALAGRVLFVTASGARFRDVPRDPAGCLLLLRVLADGQGYEVLWGGRSGRNPTMEFLPHLKIHEHIQANGLPDRAVLHSHPAHLIALSHMPEYRTQDFVRVLEVSQTTAKVFLEEGVGMAGYAPMGSEKLAGHTVELLKGRRIVLWERHGCIAVGRDVFEAFDLIDMLEKAAQVFFACVSAGYEPRRMTYEEIASLGH